MYRHFLSFLAITTDQPRPKFHCVKQLYTPQLSVLFTVHTIAILLTIRISISINTPTILNCTSLYPPQIVRFQSPGSNPVLLTSTAVLLALTQRPLPESFKIGCVCLVLSKAPHISTHYIHQYRRLCCTSL